ncbi:MAG TPA: Gfo/Idh/MocA family oxidoreductase [Candidatus Limnocylindria bacterium]|nr:Gfo/Idh/MocA family oxidoreductase [Candidatus Limnocylindria bacterium]
MSAIDSVRVGVWGVGAWGEKHARVYHALAGAGGPLVFVGCHDRHPEKSQAAVARFGGRTFATPDELLSACDAVSIAVPTVAHRAATEQALAAHCHVLVEKPMAASVTDADAMIAAAERARRTLQVGQVERFNPAVLAARPHVLRPKFIEAHRLAVFQPRSLDIDVVFDLMIHDLDLVLQAVGAPPENLSAVGVAVLSANEDIANARLEFEDGCVANLTASRVSQERLRRIRFFQADAYLSVDLFEKSGELLRVDARAMRSAVAAHDPAGALQAIQRTRLEVEPGEPLTLELDAFVRSLRGEGAGAAAAHEGREALRIAEDVRAAMKRRAVQWATG